MTGTTDQNGSTHTRAAEPDTIEITGDQLGAMVTGGIVFGQNVAAVWAGQAGSGHAVWAGQAGSSHAADVIRRKASTTVHAIIHGPDPIAEAATLLRVATDAVVSVMPDDFPADTDAGMVRTEFAKLGPDGVALLAPEDLAGEGLDQETMNILLLAGGVLRDARAEEYHVMLDRVAAAVDGLDCHVGTNVIMGTLMTLATTYVVMFKVYNAAHVAHAAASEPAEPAEASEAAPTNPRGVPVAEDDPR